MILKRKLRYFMSPKYEMIIVGGHGTVESLSFAGIVDDQ